MTILPKLEPLRSEVVTQGEFRISRDHDVALTTVLGSCVAVCLHDPISALGGMNHFLLPGDGGRESTGLRYGVHAMELLINALLKEGARRSRLVAKVFGGARMTPAHHDIGAANAAFAREFLAKEGLPVLAESLGGARARRLKFFPPSGRVRMLFVPPQDWQEPWPHPALGSCHGGIDLF